MNQRSERLRIHSLHLDLLLLGLPHVAGEHGCEIVRHSTQDQSAIQKRSWINALVLDII